MTSPSAFRSGIFMLMAAYLSGIPDSVPSKIQKITSYGTSPSAKFACGWLSFMSGKFDMKAVDQSTYDAINKKYGINEKPTSAGFFFPRLQGYEWRLLADV
jgi:hypothetical protein